jgi:hypothetical protein
VVWVQCAAAIAETRKRRPRNEDCRFILTPAKGNTDAVNWGYESARG